MLTTPKQDQAIYNRDILLWVETTVAKLKARDFENLDIDNLIEEIESLGISQKKELLNRLTTLLEHLLKRMYVNIPYDYNGWKRTIRTQRKKLEVLLLQVPSLKSQWEIAFPQAWKIALKTVKAEYYQVNFPESWLFASDLESILNDSFWQDINPEN